MIFVDTDVVMYAVGRSHPLQEEVRQRLLALPVGGLATSAEVLQELLHAYLPANRLADLDHAFQLVADRMQVWSLTFEDGRAARRLADVHPALSARDLAHLALCRSHQAQEPWTYDRGLAAAFSA